MKSKATRLVITQIIHSVLFGNPSAAGHYAPPSLQGSTSGGYFERWWQFSTQLRRSYQEGTTNVTIVFTKVSNKLDAWETMGSAWPYVSVAAVLILIALATLFVVPVLFNRSVHLAKRKQKRSAFVPVQRNSSRVSPVSSIFLAIASLFTVCGIAQVYTANQLFNTGVFHFTTGGLATVNEAWARSTNLPIQLSEMFDSIINTMSPTIRENALDVPEIMSPIRDPAESAAAALINAAETRFQLEKLSGDLSLLQSDLSNRTARLDAQLKEAHGILQNLSGNRNISGPPVSVYVYDGQASPMMIAAGPWTVQNYSALPDLRDSFTLGALPSNSALANATQTITDVIQTTFQKLNSSMDAVYNEFENASIAALQQAETTMQAAVLDSSMFQMLVAQLNGVKEYATQKLNPEIQRSNNARSYVTLTYLAIILGLSIVSYFAICKVRADIIKCIATLLCVFVGFSFLLCAAYLMLGVSIDTLCNHTYDEIQTRYFAADLRAHNQDVWADRIELLADLSDVCGLNGLGLLNKLEDQTGLFPESTISLLDNVISTLNGTLGLGSLFQGVDPSAGQKELSSLPKLVFNVAPVIEILDQLRQVANTRVVSDDQTISNLATSLKLAFEDLQAQNFVILRGPATPADALDDFSPDSQELLRRLQTLQSSTTEVDTERSRFALKIQEISSALERATALNAEFAKNITAASSGMKSLGDLTAEEVQAGLVTTLQTTLSTQKFDGMSLLQRIGNCSFLSVDGKALRASICTQTLLATDGLALSHGQLGTYVLMFVICLYVMARRIVLTTPKEPSGGEFVVISCPSSRNGTIRSTKSGKGGTYRSVKSANKSGTLRSIKATRPYDVLYDSPDTNHDEWPGQHHHPRSHYSEHPISPNGTYGKPRTIPRNGGHAMEECQGRNYPHPTAHLSSTGARRNSYMSDYENPHPPVYPHDYESDRRGSGDTMH